jgi:hypothetical protein
LKYKCANCYSCPCCKNLLMIRASTVKTNKDGAVLSTSTHSSASNSLQTTPTDPLVGQQQQQQQTLSVPGAAAAAAAQPQVQKVFYLMCGFCRWTTRDVGLPDAQASKQTLNKPPYKSSPACCLIGMFSSSYLLVLLLQATGGWKMLENANQARVKELRDAYQAIAVREKFEKDRKKYTSLKNRRFHISPGASGLSVTLTSAGGGTTPGSLLHSDKYGLLSSAQKRLHQVGTPGSGLAVSGAQSAVDLQTPIDQMLKSLVKPSATVDTFEPVSDEFFTQETNINSSNSLSLCKRCVLKQVQRFSRGNISPKRLKISSPLILCNIIHQSSYLLFSS